MINSEDPLSRKVTLKKNSIVSCMAITLSCLVACPYSFKEPASGFKEPRGDVQEWMTVQIVDIQNRTQDILFLGQLSEGIRYSRTSVGLSRCGVDSGDFESEIDVESEFAEVRNIAPARSGNFVLKFRFHTTYENYTERQVVTSLPSFQESSKDFPNLLLLLNKVLYGPRSDRGYSWFLTNVDK